MNLGKLLIKQDWHYNPEGFFYKHVGTVKYVLQFDRKMLYIFKFIKLEDSQGLQVNSESVYQGRYNDKTIKIILKNVIR